MNKEEIIRICNEYNDSKSYELAFGKSKDLGLITEVIPLVQKSIPSLQAQLINLWKLELQQLSGFAYLNRVIEVLPRAAVRLTGIKHIARKELTTFSFAFNLSAFAKRGITIEGIPVISFIVHLSISGKEPAGRGRLVILKNDRGSEKYTPLKKAS